MQPIRVLQQVNTTTCNWDRPAEPTLAGLPFAQKLHTLDSNKAFPYLIINMIIKKSANKAAIYRDVFTLLGKKSANDVKLNVGDSELWS